MLCSSVLLVAVPDVVAGPGPTRSTSENLAAKRYVAAGDRAYVIGAEDGTFPPMGWHIRGEMGGVWQHPIKLLDGYWFGHGGRWLDDASRFTSGPGYVALTFPRIGRLRFTRTEFSPDGIPAVLVGLTMTNTSRSGRTVVVKMDVRSELMAAYPWGWTEPNAREFNNKDRGSYSADTLTFREPGRTWFAKVGSSIRPFRGATGDRFWGPVRPPERAEYLEYGNGTGGQLRWRIRVPGAGSRTLWVAAAGSHTSEAEAAAALRAALADPSGSLARKIERRRELLGRTRVTLPDPRLQAAFDWGKLNLADLKRTVTDVEVRDVDEGRAYPPPVARLPRLTGIGAGYPDYPWYFGTDGAYTAWPLVASGQWEEAKDHLRAIKVVSRAINGASGKVIHEVVTDGSVYFGALHHPGNTNETAQFATAVELLWKWSGDDAFRDEMYDFVRDGIRYITSSGCPVDPSGEGTCDNDGDGWPEGRGMVERSGMGAEKLDVTAYTWQALRALHRMAESKGDAGTAAWTAAAAADMQKRFDPTWWMPQESLYADSLCNPGDVSTAEGNVCRVAGQRLQQRHWINATPMEVQLAPFGHANEALDTLESRDFTGSCGLFHTGRGGGPTGEGELKCWTLPTAVMAVAEANHGRLDRDQALFYMDAIAAELDLEMPGALPEIVPSPEYDPFVDFRERAMFMQAWSSYGTQWPVVHHFLGVRPDVPRGRLAVIPDVPESWPGLAAENVRVGDGAVAVAATKSASRFTTTVSAPAGSTLVIGHTLPRAAVVRLVTLDGRPVAYEVVDTYRGREVRVVTTTDEDHELVVTTG